MAGFPNQSRMQRGEQTPFQRLELATVITKETQMHSPKADLVKSLLNSRRVLPLGMLAAMAMATSYSAAAQEVTCPENTVAPKVTVMPSPLYVSGSGPWTQAIEINVDLIDDQTSYTDLAVKFDGNLAYSGAKVPSKNVCTNKTGGTGTCTEIVIDGADVKIGYTATFDALRQYPIEVTANKSGPNDVCETAQFVVLEFLAVEFKAPPALANEYLNSDPYYSSLSGKRRGCVISQVANHHAKESKYGPKGGDGVTYPGVGYDLVAIRADVDFYFGSGCTK
jgi:hypothetical protein